MKIDGVVLLNKCLLSLGKLRAEMAAFDYVRSELEINSLSLGVDLRIIPERTLICKPISRSQMKSDVITGYRSEDVIPHWKQNEKISL